MDKKSIVPIIVIFSGIVALVGVYVLYMERIISNLAAWIAIAVITVGVNLFLRRLRKNKE